MSVHAQEHTTTKSRVPTPMCGRQTYTCVLARHVSRSIRPYIFDNAANRPSVVGARSIHTRVMHETTPHVDINANRFCWACQLHTLIMLLPVLLVVASLHPPSATPHERVGLHSCLDSFSSRLHRVTPATSSRALPFSSGPPNVRVEEDRPIMCRQG